MKDHPEISLEIIQQAIPQLNHASAIEPIHKGYSTDLKIIVHFITGGKKLLRLFELELNDQKLLEYETLKSMEKYEVMCSKALAFGEIPALNRGYMLLSYMDGVDAEAELASYTEEQQYQIGVEAGQQLLKMHQCVAPESISLWYERKIIKHRRVMIEYNNQSVRIKQDEKIIAFMESNLELMKDRPNLFQHDDFHLGNLIVRDGKLAGVIDFNRYDWGDPIHEFLKLGFFSKRISIPFAIGQIKGYHNFKEPDELFWKLYALYIAMCLCSSVVWILKVKPDELNDMLSLIYKVTEDHQNFELIKPSWYKA